MSIFTMLILSVTAKVIDPNAADFDFLGR
jgi:hypothetical protein